ncbi:uncharacterized protein LOC111083408 [Limulus polyphemus]|uniref:Uncharacterized protein LOC111083408 n=1 Tax=Limulus polyphemus TaxID=6850 RepID=A0ABM1RW72_LIMPO|nr:uncharacterized protein LOC111083408 [Limulus polyphemus]
MCTFNLQSLLIKCVDAYRKAYVYLGEVMTSEGRLSDPRLIFFLTHDEIGQLLKNRSPKLISKAFHRQRLHSKMDHMRFPEIMKGVPRPENIKKTERLDADRSFLCMKGTPVSQGVVKGPATVINFLSEASNIKVCFHGNKTLGI